MHNMFFCSLSLTLYIYTYTCIYLYVHCILGSGSFWQEFLLFEGSQEALEPGEDPTNGST